MLLLSRSFAYTHYVDSCSMRCVLNTLYLHIHFCSADVVVDIVRSRTRVRTRVAIRSCLERPTMRPTSRKATQVQLRAWSVSRANEAQNQKQDRSTRELVTKVSRLFLTGKECTNRILFSTRSVMWTSLARASALHSNIASIWDPMIYARNSNGACVNFCASDRSSQHLESGRAASN